jgi:hypothetical protein
VKRNTLVFLAYTAISCIYFGWRLLPHPGRVLIGAGSDPFIFAWSFAWWPHALETGTNPFVTHALYAPEGVNLAWTASAPGLAFAFAPLTLLAGPVVSVNVAALLMPALSAWTAYYLCHYLTRSVWASAIGGYLFGFSSFVVGEQLQEHLHLTAAFLIPIVALVVIRYVRGELTGRGLAWRFGLLIAAQLSISTEMALSMTIALAVGLLLAWALIARARPRVVSALLPIVAGYGIAAVAVAPLVAYLLTGFRNAPFPGSSNSSTDLADFLIPSRINGLFGGSFPSVSVYDNPVEAAGYLGLPTLVIIALYAWRARRTAVARFLVVSLLLAAFITVGDVLRIDGHLVGTMPWSLARHVPLLQSVRPVRFAIYFSLTASVIVALWLSTARGLIYSRPYLLPLLAVAFLVPAFWHDDFHNPVQRWAFFTDGLDKQCLAQGETVAAFPWSDEGPFMLAQAESGFRFRIAGGYLLPSDRTAVSESTFDRDPTVYALRFESGEELPTMPRLLGFAGTHGVDRFLVDPTGGYPTAAQLRAAGSVGQAGDLLVAPGCGRPALDRRTLHPYVQLAAAQVASGSSIGWCLGPNYYALPVGFGPAGILAGAKHADLIEGEGLGCTPPAGYVRDGLATAAMGVPANTYPYYRKA